MNAQAPDGYDPRAFAPFAVTVDLAVFTLRADRLQVLLVRGAARSRTRTAGHCPAASSLPRESADRAARRELAEETGLSEATAAHLHLEQLRACSDPDRDRGCAVVSVAYTALGPDLPEPRGGADAADAATGCPTAPTGRWRSTTT